MFNNGAGERSSSSSADPNNNESTTTTTTEIVESSSEKGKDLVSQITLRVQDILTYGIVAWTIYLLGDSIRLVIFPPPPPPV